MRAALVVMSLALSSSTALLAQEPPPIAEPAPEPKAVEPPAEPLTPETPAPEKKGDGKGDGKKAPAPEKSSGGFGEGACWGSTAGCAVVGCLPGAGTAVGASVLLTSLGVGLAQGGALGVCAVVGGVVGGTVIGAPSAVILGPCASGGALAGGLIGAAVDDRSIAPVFLGALPGLFAGILGTAGAIWGLVVLQSSSGDYTTPALILGTSAAVALLSGPITIAGETIADGLAGPSDAHAGGTQQAVTASVRTPVRERVHVVTAMAY